MIQVAVFVSPLTVCSSLSQACDAFSLANRLAGQRLFALHRFSVDGLPVVLDYAQIQVDGDLSSAESANVVLLPATGSDIDNLLAQHTVLLAWLAHRPSSQQLASICSSAFLLAAAGLLDGGPATTHWALADSFRRRFPQVRLDERALLSQQHNRFCSGGAQAGLDLCLHLIDWHAGPWLAQQVAAALVVERHRGLQSRFQPLLPEARQDDAGINALLLWLQRHHAQALDLEQLAARLHCSTRSLLRRFKAATGLTPIDYLQRLRISAAQSALHQPQRSLEQVAQAVGYQDRATFARLFKQLCGETPGAFRRRVRDSPP